MTYLLHPDSRLPTLYHSLDAAIIVGQSLGPFTIWYDSILVCLWTELSGLVWTDEWKTRMVLNEKQYERMAG